MNTDPRQIASERDKDLRYRKIWLTAVILLFVSPVCLSAQGQSATTAKSSPKPAKQTPAQQQQPTRQILAKEVSGELQPVPQRAGPTVAADQRHRRSTYAGACLAKRSG